MGEETMIRKLLGQEGPMAAYEVGKRYEFISNDGKVCEIGTCTAVGEPDADGNYTVTFQRYPSDLYPLTYQYVVEYSEDA